MLVSLALGTWIGQGDNCTVMALVAAFALLSASSILAAWRAESGGPGKAASRVRGAIKTRAESWRLAVQLSAAHEETVAPYLNETPEEVAAPSRALLWQNVYARRATLALAAVSLLVVVALVLLRVSAPEVNPAGGGAGPAANNTQGDSASPAASNARGDDSLPVVVEVGQESDLQRASNLPDGVRFRWRFGPPGSTYDITVTTADMVVVAEARGLKVPEYRVSAAQLKSVTSGAPLLWQAVVHMPEGATLATTWALVSVGASDPVSATGESDLVAVMRVVDVYKRAIESEDLMLYKTLRPGLAPQAEGILRKNFSERDYLEVLISLENMPRVNDRTATVGIGRRDTFILRADPQRQIQHEAIRESLSLEKTSTGWVILN